MDIGLSGLDGNLCTYLDTHRTQVALSLCVSDHRDSLSVTLMSSLFVCWGRYKRNVPSRPLSLSWVVQLSHRLDCVCVCVCFVRFTKKKQVEQYISGMPFSRAMSLAMCVSSMTSSLLKVLGVSTEVPTVLPRFDVVVSITC